MRFADSKEASSEDEDVENEEGRQSMPISQWKKVKQPKQRVQKKPITRTQQEESSSSDSEVSDPISNKELLTLGGDLSSGVVALEHLIQTRDR